jgi:hypothetical protein
MKPAYLSNLGSGFGVVWVTFPTSTKLSRLSSKLSVSFWMVTLTSLHVSLISETPSQNRFRRDVADLGEAIMAQQAVRLTPDGHPHKPTVHVSTTLETPSKVIFDVYVTLLISMKRSH